MSGNPTLSPFSGWNEMHGGSMDRNPNPKMGQRGEADRRSRVLSVALRHNDSASIIRKCGFSRASFEKNVTTQHPLALFSGQA